MDPYVHSNSCLNLPGRLSCHKRITRVNAKRSQWSITSSGGSAAQILRSHLDLIVGKKKIKRFVSFKKTPSSGCWATQSQHWTSVMSTTGLVLKPSVARLEWHLAMMAEGSCLSLQHCSNCLLRCKNCQHNSGWDTCCTHLALLAHAEHRRLFLQSLKFMGANSEMKSMRLNRIVLICLILGSGFMSWCWCPLATPWPAILFRHLFGYKRYFWQTTEHTQ